MLEDQEQDDLLDDQMMDQLIPDADEDFANTPGSEPVEGGSEDELQDNGSRGKRKRHHRHTTDQIQRLEAFFKECPHPDDRQRNELGRELGLEPLQVKFWFQNKRTQIKVCLLLLLLRVPPTKNLMSKPYIRHHRTSLPLFAHTHSLASCMQNQSEREENQRLKDENDRLLSENLRLKEALSGACCPNCGGPPHLGEMSIDEQELQAENARLQDEVRTPHNRRPEMGRRTGLALAQVAAEELLAMSQLREPIWTWGSDGFRETLNQEEYARAFPGGLGPKMASLRTEASRETAVVRMDAGRLVDILMDVSKWSVFFSSIVTRATTVEMFATGIGDGGYDGALQLLSIFLSFVANPDGTRNILKLAERMVVSFCSGVSGSVAHHWTNISGTVADPVRIRSRNNDGVPGRPPGVVLNASTSIWLPVTPKRVFELLRSESLRNEVFRGQH
ncbi:hypothetical protein B296_00048235 [Ensete ventricosum]|uniref:Homeobox domain-containing protein n=1 Tax=Ensete ventricosum TaxID=4639 RepID=A0A426XSZ1_ENSVE|nr:hypothetical protein B296_00048235 [Ensete ventricosum]